METSFLAVVQTMLVEFLLRGFQLVQLKLHQSDTFYGAYELQDVLDLETLETVIDYHRTSQAKQSLVLWETFVALKFVDEETAMLFRVAIHVSLIHHIVVPFLCSLVANLQEISYSLALTPQTYLQDPLIQRRLKHTVIGLGNTVPLRDPTETSSR